MSISSEILLIPSLLILAVIVGFLPALAAYRTDVAGFVGQVNSRGRVRPGVTHLIRQRWQERQHPRRRTVRTAAADRTSTSTADTAAAGDRANSVSASKRPRLESPKINKYPVVTRAAREQDQTRPRASRRPRPCC